LSFTRIQGAREPERKVLTEQIFKLRDALPRAQKFRALHKAAEAAQTAAKAAQGDREQAAKAVEANTAAQLELSNAAAAAEPGRFR
jgi:hypothetical protein